ncbi:MAG: hypothetical protein HY727_04585 [Candidatus Rokubacteria bacterium]|nr:hypothetical protein [Candidatus Rokubacteria bacterium]
MKPISVVSAGLLVVLGALVVQLLWLSLPWPLIHDAPVMHYIAWRISEGAVPYRDIFDMNFPGVYLLHLAVFEVLGTGDVAWRMFDLASLAATALAIGALAAPWGRVAALGSALVFAAYHLAGGAWHAGQRDFLLCPFLLLGALSVARWVEGRRGLAWGGAALGAAVMLKPHAAALAVAFGVVVVVAARRQGRPILAPLVVFATSLALAPLAVLAWLGAVGAVGAWRSIVIDYVVPLYSRLGWSSVWTFHRWQVWIAIGVAVLLSVASAVAGRRFGARHAVVTVGVGYGLAHFVGQGKGWEYHLYPLAAFAAVLAFCELEQLVEARRLAVAVPLAASLVAVFLGLEVKGAEAASAAWIWDKERVVRLLTQDLGRQLRPGDRVQVLDTTEGGVHALLRLGVPQATRFLYDFHFFHDTAQPVIQGLRRELLRELAARPPRFVVLFERGWPTGAYERVDGFPELARWLEAGYSIDTQRAGYVIYAKRSLHAQRRGS